MSKQSVRKQWIDFLRGIAMLLVIWGHIAPEQDLFFVITSPFKIPLFFAITGYVFNDRNGDWKIFGKKLFFSIIIPWLVLSLVWARALSAIVHNDVTRIPVLFYNLVSGKTLWFMPCIIVAETIQFFIRWLLKTKRDRYIAMVVAAAIGLFLGRRGMARFALLDVALVSQAFMLFGLWYKDHEQWLAEKLGLRVQAAGLALYVLLIAVSIFAYPGRSLDVHMNEYYNYLICGAMIFLSLLLLFLFFSGRRSLPRWIVFVGQNTLAFYMLHGFVRSAFAKCLSVLGIRRQPMILWEGIEMVAVCASVSVLALIINRWLPFIAGKQRRLRVYHNQRLR